MYKLIKPVISSEEIDEVSIVLLSGWLSEGGVTKEFEKKFAEYIGCKYAIATTNCTSALESVLKMKGINKGDQVIVPDFTHPATADVVKLVGAEPLLADVNLYTRNIEVSDIDYLLDKYENAKAIIAVSWGGYPLNIYDLKDYESILIEDAACSHGSAFNNIRSGNMGVAGCFSFHPRKVITTGEGGMITTNDENLAYRISEYKNFGYSQGNFNIVGSNLRMPDVLGAIGLCQMGKIDNIIKKRRTIADWYEELLNDLDEVLVPNVKDSMIFHNYQTYAIYLKSGNRDKIILSMKERGIETQIGTYALHLLPAFSKLKRSVSLTTSEHLYNNLLTLPVCDDMDYHDIDFIVSNLKEVM